MNRPKIIARRGEICTHFESHQNGRYLVCRDCGRKWPIDDKSPKPDKKFRVRESRLAHL